MSKKKISSTNKRKTKRRFAETPRDVSEGPEFHIEDSEVAMEVQELPEGPEFHMEDAEGAMEVQEQPEGPEFCMEDAECAREVQEQPEGPEFCMEDSEGAREVQEQPEGPEFCMEDSEGAREVQEQPEGPQPQERAGGGRRRLQLWQWNRIYPRGPYTPRNIHFTGNEGMQQPLPPNPTAEDFFKLYINEDIIDHIVTQTNLYAQ